MSPERRSRRARLRGWLLAAVLACFLLSVPWYRDPERPVQLWLGLPDWVAVALLCYVGVAVLNAAAWGLTDLRDEAADAPPRSGPKVGGPGA